MQEIIAECGSNPLDCVLLVMPHSDSDWLPYLESAQQCVREIAQTIMQDTDCVMVLPLHQTKESLLKNLASHPRMHALFAPTNDTWARDFAPLALHTDSGIALLKCTFNAWGEKFDSNLDNALAFTLEKLGLWKRPLVQNAFVLEGGSIESNGAGCLLTTTACLLHPKRNPHLSQAQIESWLQNQLGAQKVLWLENGFLQGDDTDCHIDNLARFIDSHTIVYVCCEDKTDVHFESLQKMQDELRAFRDCNNAAFTLVPLPMCQAVYYDNERLPASYANFLILENRILLPFFGSDTDKEAQRILQQHTNKEVVGVDCQVLVRQHGGLHCMSMQFARGSCNL